MLPFMDATDGLAAAYCHYLQMGRPTLTKEYSGWKDFINTASINAIGHKLSLIHI